MTPTIKRYLIIVSIIFVLAFFYHREVRVLNVNAIREGLKFYDDKSLDNELRVDDAFLLQLIQGLIKDRYATLNVERTIPNFAPDPLSRLLEREKPVLGLSFFRRPNAYEPLPHVNNNSYLIDRVFEQYLRDPYDDILWKALYCDLSGYDEVDFATLRSIRSMKGDYADTHFLLSLLLLKENKCFDDKRLAVEIQATVQPIANAAKEDTAFSDLYAERIVFLYWAGYGNVIKNDWIEIIRKARTADPGWRDSGVRISNAHTTGLALLALIYFEEGKPKQSFW